MAQYIDEVSVPRTPYDILEIEDFLQGVVYPATKREILDVALDNGSPDDILMFLNTMPDREYLRFDELNTTLEMMISR